MNARPEIFSGDRTILVFRLVANGIFQVAAMLAIAFTMRGLFDRSFADDPGGNRLLVAGATMTGSAVLLGLLKYRERVDAEILGQNYISDLRMMVFAHVGSLSAHRIAETRKGLLLLRFVNDLSAIRQWISLGIARLIVSSLVIIGALGILTAITPMLGGALLLLLALGAGVSILIGKRLDGTIRESRRRRAIIAGNMSEKLENIPVMQAFAQRKSETKKVRRHTQGLQTAMIDRASAIGVFRGWVHVVVGLALTTALCIGSYLVDQGTTTQGDIVAALGIISLASFSLHDFGRAYEYQKSAAIAFEKTENLLATKPVIKPASEPVSISKRRLSLAFEKVTVKGIINNVSAQIKYGSRVIVMGRNGSGKSTLMMLALRLIDPDKGVVKLGGHDIRQIRTGKLRRKISIAGFTFPLLRGTIKSNIAYGCAKATDEQIALAASICRMNADDPASPYYFKRKVAEGGANLSAGEQMRVILARAIVGNPSILLLDEPDSHLDDDGLAILDTILKEYPGTVIFATHNPDYQTYPATHWRLDNAGITQRELVS